MDKFDVLQMRLFNNGITNKFNDIITCVEKLHGIQAQYDLYSYISLYNRVKDFSLVDIIDTNVVKSWGQRVTLHINTKSNMLMNAKIYSKNENWIKKYFIQLDANIDQVLSDVLNGDYCSDRITKKEIANNIKHKSRYEMLQWGGIIAEASLNGFLYENIDLKKGKTYSFIDYDKYRNNDNFNSCIETLIEKYIQSYGPATCDDFLHWSGLKSERVAKAFDIVSDKYKKIYLEGKKYVYVDNMNFQTTSEMIMLGKFDPLLLAYRDKTWIADRLNQKNIWKAAGHVEGVIIKNNILLGTWRSSRKKEILELKVHEIKKLTISEKNRIEIRAFEISKAINLEKARVLFL